MAVTVSRLWLSVSVLVLSQMGNKQVMDWHWSGSHAFCDTAFGGVANEWDEAGVWAGRDSEPNGENHTWYLELPDSYFARVSWNTRGSRKEGERKKTLCSKTASLGAANEDSWTQHSKGEAQSPPHDEASPALSTRLALAQPSTAAAKAIQSKHGSRHSRLNRTKTNTQK